MKKILFKNVDGSVGVITPTAEALSKYTIEQVAKKDVPANLEYWIVDTTTVPSDRTFRNAWEVDPSIGAAHGVGNTTNTWE